MKPFGPDKATRFSTRALQAFASAGLPLGLQMKAATTDAPAEILLYDEIGFWGVTGQAFVEALAQAGAGPITVRINSPGGAVFDGMAIYNAIRAHKGGVTIQVDGIAASAASYIAMAGETVVMGEASMLMIHNAWTISVGNRHEMAKNVDLLTKIDGQQVEMFAEKTGKTPEEITAWLDAETYFTAQEAVDHGFADSIAPAAKRDKKPDSTAAKVDPPQTPEPQREPDAAATLAASAEKLKRRVRIALARGEIASLS